jgi:branched-chain amino acid aminotransferase
MTNKALGTHVWIGGEMVDANQAAVPLTDRGFTLGDGLFETMLWTGREIRFFDDHIARLAQSGEALGFELPCSVGAVKAGLNALGDDAAGSKAALRLTLTRGSGPRGLAIPTPAHPQLIATIAPLVENATAVRVKTVSIPRAIGTPSTRFKTLSYLDNVIALREARAGGSEEAIMLGTNGNVACASSANLVVRYKGASLTPALEDGALGGIVRRRLLAVGLIEEVHIVPSQLAQCEQAVLTNALIGVRGVASIDGRDLNASLPWCQSLMRALDRV